MRLLIPSFLFSLILLTSASPQTKYKSVKTTSFRIPLSDSNKPEGFITFSIPPNSGIHAFLQHPLLLQTSEGNRVSSAASRPVSVHQSGGSTESGSGLTLEECTTSDDCAGNRDCVYNPPARPSICIPSNGLQFCTSSNVCDSGEVCGLLPSGRSVCAAAKFAEPLRCIAVHLLQHLSRDELIFEKDRLSNVLCDGNGSCATSGHMVVYHGKGMMMKSYCDLVGRCVRKIMAVNSPRYRRGLAVPSKSEDLAFTASSARYVTRAEEGFLSAAIRFGF